MRGRRSAAAVDRVAAGAPAPAPPSRLRRSPRRRAGAAALGLAVLAAVFTAGAWAGRTAFLPPDDPLEAPAPATYTVAEGTVGHVLRFAAVAEWDVLPVVGGAAGTVTSVDLVPGATVAAGDVLYAIDLRPAVAAPGPVPMFRQLAAGARGDDVAQLQRFLAAAGFFGADPDGRFGAGTTAAVRAWQRSLDVAEDGVVRAGDVVFVAELPARMVPADDLVVGRRVTTETATVGIVAGDPAFRVPLAVDQRDLVPLSAPVRVISGTGDVWPAVAGAAVEGEPGRLDLLLEAPGGGPVCGAGCAAAVPFGAPASFDAEVVVVPEATGPLVPVAAITSDPGGGLGVTLADGTRAPVTIVSASDGLAVVDGLAPGQAVVLPVPEGP